MLYVNYVSKKEKERINNKVPLYSTGFLGGSDGKESSCNTGNLGWIPGLGRSPGGGHGNPLQYSCLENPHGQRSLVGYSPQGRKESDTTEWLSIALYSTGNYIQYPVTNCNGKQWKKECTCVYNWITLQINYTSITKQKWKENINRYNGLKETQNNLTCFPCRN